MAKKVKTAREIRLDGHGIRMIIQDDILRVRRNAPPLGATIPFAFICAILLASVGLSLRTLVSLVVSLVGGVGLCMKGLPPCLFLTGFVILALLWVILVIFDFLLPGANEIGVRTKELTIWKGFIRRRVRIESGTQLSVVVLSPPRAAWGYRIDLINRGKKYNLVPFVCVGSRRNSIVKGESTADLIMSVIPYLVRANMKKIPREGGVLSIRRRRHFLGLR